MEQVKQGDLENIPVLFRSADSGLDRGLQTRLELIIQSHHVAILELKDFTFTRHTTHKLPKDWLEAGETMSQKMCLRNYRTDPS